MTSTARRRLIAIVLTVLAPLGLAVCAVTPAGAATASAGRHTHVVFRHMGAAGIAGKRTPDEEIDCDITALDPLSWPAGAVASYAAVTGASSVQCTAPVANITLTTILTFDGMDGVSSGPMSHPESSSFEVNLQTECDEGVWQTTGDGVITAPPGFEPAVYDITDTGFNTPIDIC